MTWQLAWNHMNERPSSALLVIFGLLGFAASGTATWVHYQLIRDPGATSFCDISARISCRQAYLSQFGSFAGAPVALWGLCFFALVLLLLWGGSRSARVRENSPGYIFALSTIGLAFVLYLAYASFFILKEICPLCVTTYLAVLGLFLASGAANTASMSSLVGKATRDLRALVVTPFALVIAVIFVGGAASAIAFFPRPEDRPVIAAQPLTDEQKGDLERWWNVQPRVALPISSGGAKVLLVKFSDYQCPACRATYFAYEPLLAKYKDRPQDFKYVLQHFPLSSECNPAVKVVVHPASCTAAAAVVMARPKGTADKLNDWLFVHQDELSPSVVRGAARDVGGITDFNADYSAALEQIKNEGALGGSLHIDQTPTYFLNGRKIAPAITSEAMDFLIQLELKSAAK
jgi:uncharacterized membrane protein/protein-disulfide isomerase